MEDPSQLSEYGKILLIAIIGLVLVCGTIFLAKTISPRNPNPLKLSTYECGEDSRGSAWVQFNPRFYIVALVFLLFDVELIFVFPWATIFGNSELIQADVRWGWFTLIEMGIFLAILVIGLVYVWVNGDLNWVKPTHETPQVQVGIPASAYQHLNSKTYQVRDHRSAQQIQNNKTSTPSSPASAGAKPAFKPRFKTGGSA